MVRGPLRADAVSGVAGEGAVERMKGCLKGFEARADEIGEEAGSELEEEGWCPPEASVLTGEEVEAGVAGILKAGGGAAASAMGVNDRAGFRGLGGRSLEKVGEGDASGEALRGTTNCLVGLV